MLCTCCTHVHIIGIPLCDITNRGCYVCMYVCTAPWQQLRKCTHRSAEKSWSQQTMHMYVRMHLLARAFNTVEPLLRTPLKWGHPSYIHVEIKLPWNEDTSLIRTLEAVPRVFRIEELHCTCVRNWKYMYMYMYVHWSRWTWMNMLAYTHMNNRVLHVHMYVYYYTCHNKHVIPKCIRSSASCAYEHHNNISSMYMYVINYQFNLSQLTVWCHPLSYPAADCWSHCHGNPGKYVVEPRLKKGTAKRSQYV